MLAQPLYVTGVDMGIQGVHNTVYAVTENDSVYAFDADAGAQLWTASLADPGVGLTPVPIGDIKGRVLVVYWSWDTASGKVRWKRIGQPVY